MGAGSIWNLSSILVQYHSLIESTFSPWTNVCKKMVWLSSILLPNTMAKVGMK